MSFRRAVAALLLAAYLPACTSYQATSHPVAEMRAAPRPPEHLRVTTSDGAVVEVNGPRVVNDTLYGSTRATGTRGEPSSGAVAIPVANLRTVEVRRTDGTKTRWMVGGLLLGFLIVYVASTCADDDWVC